MYPGCNAITPAATPCAQAFAEKLAEGAGVGLPANAQVNMVVCSEFIDQQLAAQGGGGGGGGAAAAGAVGGSAPGPKPRQERACGGWSHGAALPLPCAARFRLVQH